MYLSNYLVSDCPLFWCTYLTKAVGTESSLNNNSQVGMGKPRRAYVRYFLFLIIQLFKMCETKFDTILSNIVSAVASRYPPQRQVVTLWKWIKIVHHRFIYASLCSHIHRVIQKLVPYFKRLWNAQYTVRKFIFMSL